MRDDMFKVLVERPRMRFPKRNGSHYPRQWLKNRHTFEEAPLREAYGGRYREKYLSDNLAPLLRFLRSNIGRPWDAVYSELREQLTTRSTMHQHLVDHVRWEVWTKTWLENGVLFGADHYGRPRKLVPTHHGDLLYVSPTSRLLCAIPSKQRKRRSSMHTENPDVRIVSEHVELHRRSGVWFEIQFAPLPATLLVPVYDVLLRCVLGRGNVHLAKEHDRRGRRNVYAAHARQLSTREIQVRITPR